MSKLFYFFCLTVCCFTGQEFKEYSSGEDIVVLIVTFSRNYFEYKQSMSNILRFNNIWSKVEIVSLQHICLKNIQHKYEIGSRLNNECKVIL